MKVTNIHEAKTHFSKLVERAAAGEEIVIGKAGKPVARLGPYAAPAHAEAQAGRAGRERSGSVQTSTRWIKEIEKLFSGELD